MNTHPSLTNPFGTFTKHPTLGGIPPEPSAQPVFCSPESGYRGFWHEQRPVLESEYRYKYSGGLGTYCHSHQPFSVYCPEVGKTFFCWGGTTREHEVSKNLPRFDWGPGQLTHMVGCFDHHRGEVERPVTLLDKWCGDAHDNPVLSVDPKGYIWIFSPSHGNWTTPSWVHRSKNPHDIHGGFETVLGGVFAYPQAFWSPTTGLILFHVQYTGGRGTHLTKTADGKHWTNPKTLALIGDGSYQIAHVQGPHLGVIFDHHPKGKGVDARTNLYYMESFDGGETWQNARGEILHLPLTEVENPALVRNALSENLLIYIKDLQFDEKGRPVLAYLTSGSSSPGPGGDPRTWLFATFNGTHWKHEAITQSKSNYDHGALFRRHGGWDLIAPIGEGPQPYNPGGEVVAWRREDGGPGWQFLRALTQGSPSNHNFIRRGIGGHPDFLAFWADGNPREPSPSRLYFCDQQGSVYRLPETMTADRQKPERVM